jgi:RNA polymerase sigma factor (sigma-70 family)
MKSYKDEFLKIINENRAIINKISFGYTGNLEDRLDLKQEILIQLWKAFPKFRGASKISTWIYRIALNTAISNLRKEKKKFLKEELTENCNQINRLENDIELNEDITRLFHLIYQLNDLEKAIILLYLDDQSYSEIANIVGISETNAATKINRIKLKLKNQFHENIK